MQNISRHISNVDYWQADILSAYDYSPFGVMLTGRTFEKEETAGFTKLTENLNYSLAGLRANFKRLDKYSDEYLNEVRTDANKLAVLLYGGSGNGIDYRGRGLIHTTWEGNYKKASDSYNKMYGTNYDFTKNPTLLSTDHQIAVRSALIFFKTNGLFGMSNFNINDVSKKVNFYDKKSFTKRSALFDKVNSVIK